MYAPREFTEPKLLIDFWRFFARSLLSLGGSPQAKALFFQSEALTN